MSIENYLVFGLLKDSSNNPITGKKVYAINISENCDIDTTTNSPNGDYQINLKDLSTINDGDTIHIAATYSGESYSEEFVLDVDEPFKRIDLDLTPNAVVTKIDYMVMSKNEDRTYKTDAIIKGIDIEESYNIDSLLKSESEIKNIIDLVSQGYNQINENIDQLIKNKSISENEIVDLLLISDDNTRTSIIDTLIRDTDINIYQLIDLIIMKINSSKSQIDILSSKEDSESSLINLIIERAGLTRNVKIDSLVKISDSDRKELMDTLISSGLEISHLANMLISQALLQKNITIDTLIKITNLGNMNIDLQAGGGKDMDELIDLLISSSSDIGIRIDLLIGALSETKSRKIDIDLLLKKFIENNMSIDAILGSVSDRSSLIDVLAKQLGLDTNYLIDMYTQSKNITSNELIDLLTEDKGITRNMVIDAITKSILSRNIDIDMVLKKLGLHNNFVLDTLLALTDLTRNQLMDMIITRIYSQDMIIDYITRATNSIVYGIDFRSGLESKNLSYLSDMKLIDYIWINYARPTNTSMFECTNSYLAAN